VTLDLSGFQSGSANLVLPLKGARG
jgi:hypothetical protein